MKSSFVKYKLPVDRIIVFLSSVIIVCLFTNFSCNKAPLTNNSSKVAYDGVYDFSIVTTSPSGNQTIVLPPGFFIVRNGIISSSDNTLSGSVTNFEFGNVVFTGPCHINNGSANFTGILDALAAPKAGHGNYTCQIGGISRTWRAYNGR